LLSGEHSEGESPEVVARVFWIGRTAIYRWLADYRRGGWAVARMAVTGKTDFKRKVRSSMRRLQNDPGKIRSFYQKQSLKYAA
jgi:transposase